MTLPPPPEPRERAGAHHRFALQDELGRPIGTFASFRRGWRVGDWVLTRDGRRLQIVGVLPATQSVEDADVSEVWLVESA
jgi:hypothetical protein